MKKVIKAWKLVGETPLEVINRTKQEQQEYANSKMTYAGRLDPLAEGELVLLVDEMVHKKEAYTSLDKEYEVDILLGVSTDTFDTLGLVQEEGVIKKDWEEKAQKFIDSHIGEFSQKYPSYSSKTIDGTPMFQLAREGKEFEIPEHVVELIKAEIIEIKTISLDSLKHEIKNKNSLVGGDFRQEEIKSRWDDYFNHTEYLEYPVIKMRLKVGSGFYVRQFAEDLGTYLGSQALALHIKRTCIFD